MSITCENKPMTAMPAPSESPAARSGSRVASSDPNTRNSTTAAAMKPMPRLAEPLLRDPARAIWPSTSNSTPRPELDVILATNALAAASWILLDWRSKVTLAKATRPEGAIWLAPRGPYGDEMRETCGCWAATVRTCSTWARTAGSVTRPCLTAMTIWSVSPEAFGALRWSRATASKLSVLGSLKLSVYALPAAE